VTAQNDPVAPNVQVDLAWLDYMKQGKI